MYIFLYKDSIYYSNIQALYGVFNILELFINKYEILL
jgi:hypothetical protein